MFFNLVFEYNSAGDAKLKEMLKRKLKLPQALAVLGLCTARPNLIPVKCGKLVRWMAPLTSVIASAREGRTIITLEKIFQERGWVMLYDLI